MRPLWASLVIVALTSGAQAQVRPLGDANCDGVVDSADLIAVIEINFGAPNLCSRGDVNGDGTVNATDLAALISLSPPPAPTPTPSETEAATPTITLSPSPSATFTLTVTGTPPDTLTPTLTLTPSETATITPSPTVTATETTTGTPTWTATETISPTPSRTATITRTPSATRSETPTRTGTATRTFSRTPTSSRTATSTRTSTPTRTASNTRTPSPSRTATRTLTFTPSATISRTATNTRTPSMTATITPTRTATRSPTITPTLGPGPDVTFFGLASASGAPLTPVDFDPDGIPIFEPISGTGAGFLIVGEARAGGGGSPPGIRSQGLTPTTRGDFQIELDREIGNGSTAVCDTSTMDPNTPPGGVPAVFPPSFDPSSQTITDALNDFGCRFVFNNALSPCTRDSSGNPKFASPLSTAQFCSAAVVSLGFERFQAGDTLVTMQWRDAAGTFSALQHMIVRVPQ